VPPSARWNRPMWSSTAPVKAPRLWPKSSLSSSVSGMAAQFSTTKGPARRGTGVVDGARHQFLAGARFAQHQHRQVVARDARRHGTHGVQRAAGARTMRSKSKVACAPAQLLVLLGAQRRCAGAQVQLQPVQAVLQRAGLGGVAHGLQQVVGHPGLEHVLEDAGLVDAGDDVFAVGVAADDDAHHLGPAFAHLAQELDAGLAGHALVAQDHRRLVPFQQRTRARRRRWR
jgi:hypothetical protein